MTSRTDTTRITSDGLAAAGDRVDGYRAFATYAWSWRFRQALGRS